MAFLDLDEKDLLLEEKPLASLLTHIRRQLQQIREVVEVGDDMLLGDLLQYEFDTAIGQWRVMVQAVLARAQNSAAD